MRRREVRILPGALRQWRKERELTQKDLGQAAGLSPTLIAMIETGERQPSRLNAEDIAAALGIPLDALAFVYPDPLVNEQTPAAVA